MDRTGDRLRSGIAERLHLVNGHGGTQLHVRDIGRTGARPILFVHGWSQSLLSWRHQLSSSLSEEFRLVAFDLRGHGCSEAPPAGTGGYSRGEVWADDLAAVLSQLDLVDAVLVGWSFGGYVVADYLRKYGHQAISGVNFVGWAVIIGDSPEARRLIGPAFEEHFEEAVGDDLGARIRATRRFVRACTSAELPREEWETALCYNMVVSPSVRRATAEHQPCDNSELLRSLRVPVLSTQGVEDRITLPAASAYIAACCERATSSLYPGVGHSPFMEAPDRFNAELGSFARRARPLPASPVVGGDRT